MVWKRAATAAARRCRGARAHLTPGLSEARLGFPSRQSSWRFRWTAKREQQALPGTLEIAESPVSRATLVRSVLRLEGFGCAFLKVGGALDNMP
jgi:hypothetical protein